MNGCYNCGANQFGRDRPEKGEGGKNKNYFEKSKGMSKGTGKNLHEVEEDENWDDQAAWSGGTHNGQQWIDQPWTNESPWQETQQQN